MWRLSRDLDSDRSLSSRRRARRRTGGGPIHRSLLQSVRRWVTLSRVWSVLAVLAVLVMIASLIAPALTYGM